MNYSEFNETNKVAVIGSIATSTGTADGYLSHGFHWHAHYEILIVIEGEYCFKVSGHSIRSNEPAVFFIRPYTIHMMNATQGINYTRHVINFDQLALKSLYAPLLDDEIFRSSTFIYLKPTENDMSELEYIANALRHYVHNHNVRDRTMNRICLSYLIRKIMLMLEAGRGEALPCAHSYIQDALLYVGENLNEQIGIEELAKRFGVGQSKFCADFKRTTGSTYKKYTTDLRLTQASELLRSGMSILAVSLELGYSSESHFIRAFREYWGVTPAEFQRSGIK